MSGPAIDHTYRYPFPSALVSEADGERLRLATSGGAEAIPLFFRGRLVHPRQTADLLLALVRVVHSRFHIPPAMLARIMALADPVVTCGTERLRFEGFSACCSAYARLDLEAGAVEGTLLGCGTTNVDFNPPMRAALTRIREGEPVRLSVGRGEVELEAGGGSVVERKVPLPLRWLKGFLEVQAYQAGMERRLEVNGAEARRFLRSLPRGGNGARPAWVTASGAGLRLSQVAAKGSVRVAGVERLRVLEEIARHARLLRVYASENGASGWELVTDMARFHLALSPEVWRGFSGEGQALSRLADGAGETELASLRAALRWQDRLDAETLARETGLPRHDVLNGLARLGATGLVGFDVGTGAYFHRELPFDLSRVEALQPRLREARKLVENGAVRIAAQGEAGVEAWVQGSGVEHHVRLTEAGERCTCPWYGKHAGERGPCKHVLAVQLTLGADAA